MNCEYCQEQISQFVDGELSPKEEADVFSHLGICEQCRTFLKDVISLRNSLAHTKETAVPASLDQRVLTRPFPRGKGLAGISILQRYRNAQYSFRTIGLAVVLSILFTFLLSSYWYKSYESKQTIICLNPLPEVEVTGYIVNAPSSAKGTEQ
jgi:predicted anti-sigma-YlaC factor YlaD